MNHIIERANQGDLHEILKLQKSAFKSEAIKHNDLNIPPMIQTYDGINEEFKNKFFLKYSLDGKIAGSVRAYLDKTGSCHIGRLIVLPEYQNRGIGRLLMNEIETIFNECEQYKIFTGEKSEKSISLYKKLNYVETSRENAGTHDLVHMEKNNKLPT